jgi:hypothetical protein
MLDVWEKIHACVDLAATFGECARDPTRNVAVQVWGFWSARRVRDSSTCSVETGNMQLGLSKAGLVPVASELTIINNI